MYTLMDIGMVAPILYTNIRIHIQYSVHLLLQVNRRGFIFLRMKQRLPSPLGSHFHLPSQQEQHQQYVKY